MKLSIIISTLNRIKEPLLMLDSLTNQSFKDFEVLLIDQNEEAILDENLRKYFELLSLKHIKSDIKGASNARNIGIKQAKGELLSFPDDDCEFNITFLEDIYTYFKNNSFDGIVTTSKDRFDGKAISILMSSKSQPIQRKNILKTVVEFGIIVRKNKIKNVLFDPDMGVGSPNSPYWSDEGPDFILRLIKEGLSFNYCPQFYIFHPNPVKKYNLKTTIRSYQYGKGRGYFLKKHNFGKRAILYYLFIYIIGMLKGLVFFNRFMFLYFKEGFKGRYEGYFRSK
ncbi:glycosyltransferase family 2 protein [Aureibaculum algae]|uniref:Glycosyltransferase family 2 protein n=1 Tax=Aureibaculum algae TaxID=2584122 RepID=A0A5B7TPD5_9FLAO|nr:glycosyltransferase family 2 protein [Aureibaculum algae]QCX37006.1 glycosyltransferase family 2 protein [Aureibaculum algae]